MAATAATCEEQRRMGDDDKKNEKNNNNNNNSSRRSRLEGIIASSSAAGSASSSDDEGQVQERRYGCYRLGVAVAILIIVVLVIGTVPVFFSVENEKVVLIVTIITLAVVGILLLVYCLWQRNRSTNMRREVSQRELDYLDDNDGRQPAAASYIHK